MIWSFWLRAKRVKSGMLSASVAQIADHRGQRRPEKPELAALVPPGTKAEGGEDRADAAGLVDRPPDQGDADEDLERRLTSGAGGSSQRLARRRRAQRPEDSEGGSWPGRCRAVAAACRAGPRPSNTPSRLRMAMPPIQVWMPYQPQATRARSQRRQPRPERAERGAGEHRIRDAVARPACPISSIGTSTMRLPSSTVRAAWPADMPCDQPRRRIQPGTATIMPIHSEAK